MVDLFKGPSKFPKGVDPIQYYQTLKNSAKKLIRPSYTSKPSHIGKRLYKKPPEFLTITQYVGGIRTKKEARLDVLKYAQTKTQKYKLNHIRFRFPMMYSREFLDHCVTQKILYVPWDVECVLLNHKIIK